MPPVVPLQWGNARIRNGPKAAALHTCSKLESAPTLDLEELIHVLVLRATPRTPKLPDRDLNESRLGRDARERPSADS